MSTEPDQPNPSPTPDPVPGASSTPPPPAGPPPTAPQGGTPADKKLVSGILAILLGGLGIHKFYLGYQKEGIIMLVVSLVGGAFTCGIISGAVWIIGVVEGVLYLTKTDQEFDAMYVKGRKPWF